MKIGFVPAVPFFLMYGGGETQLVHPLNILKSRGLDVQEVNNFDRTVKYDVLHFFGLHYAHFRSMDMARKAGIKVVLEPISYATKKQNIGRLANIVNTYVKMPTTQYLHREMLVMSDYIIPNSLAELEYLETYFNVKLNNTAVAYNAIDRNFFDGVGSEFFLEFQLRDYLLCVGKIEPRKNQLQLAKIVANRKEKMVFIGDPVLDALDYYSEFKKVIHNNKNLYHFKSFQQNSKIFKSAYKCAKVHILLGDNETPGMTSLEAAVAGKPIVVQSCKPVIEYFGKNAHYTQPGNTESINAAIDLALNSVTGMEFSQWCKERYTWEAVADVFERVYSELMLRS